MFILSPAAAGMLLSIASLESTFFIDVEYSGCRDCNHGLPENSAA